jgi:hypothetical protein
MWYFRLPLNSDTRATPIPRHYFLKERVDATPFRPFNLGTTGGKQIRIVTPDHLLFAPESRDLIIAFEPGGNMHLLSTDQPASLKVEME